MKKFFALSLALALLLGGCSGGGTASVTDESGDSSEASDVAEFWGSTIKGGGTVLFPDGTKYEYYTESGTLPTFAFCFVAKPGTSGEDRVYECLTASAASKRAVEYNGLTVNETSCLYSADGGFAFQYLGLSGDLTVTGTVHKLLNPDGSWESGYYFEPDEASAAKLPSLYPGADGDKETFRFYASPDNAEMTAAFESAGDGAEITLRLYDFELAFEDFGSFWTYTSGVIFSGEVV